MPFFSAQALVCTSTKNGNWSDATVWSCGRVPLAGDQVVVAHDVILNTNVALNYSTGSVGYSLVVNAGASLIDNGTHTLQIGQNSGTGYNGINILGLLDVYILTLEKADDPVSVIGSTGEVIVRCYFENTNRGDIDVNGFLNIKGDWHIGNGNTDTDGGGFVLVAGCLNTSGGGNLGNITVDFCVVQPAVDCLCFNGGSNSGAVTNPNGTGGGSQGTTGSSEAECLAILPVTYLSFTGRIEKSTAISNAKSIIEWTTVSEINNDRFVVERSHEGKLFKEIATVKSKGGKNTLTSYSFVDENVEEGVYYYRLKEVSPSNEIAYSPVITLTVNVDLFFKVFPNPISKGQKLYIYYPSKIESIQIKTTQGRVVFEQLQEGEYNSDIEIPINLPKGLYMIEFSTEEGIAYRRLIVE